MSKARSLSTDYLETGNSKSDLRIALAVPGSENDDDVEPMMKMSYLELAAKILLINVNVAVNRGQFLCFIDLDYKMAVVEEAQKLSSIDDNTRINLQLSHMRHLHHRRKCNLKINTFPGLPRPWEIWPNFPGPRQPWKLDRASSAVSRTLRRGFGHWKLETLTCAFPVLISSFQPRY